MEHIDHDYLSTQVIQIPSKSKTSFSSAQFYSLKISRAFHSGAVFTMQNVLPRSGARAYTVSDDASADQRYNILAAPLKPSENQNVTVHITSPLYQAHIYHIWWAWVNLI